MTLYFTQPVKPSRGSFKDRISRTCLSSYWWRVSVERWIMINKPQKWNCLRHTRYAGWLFLSRNIGSEKCECSYQLSCFIQWNTSISYQCKILSQRVCGDWICKGAHEFLKSDISVYQVQLQPAALYWYLHCTAFGAAGYTRYNPPTKSSHLLHNGAARTCQQTVAQFYLSIARGSLASITFQKLCWSWSTFKMAEGILSYFHL